MGPNRPTNRLEEARRMRVRIVTYVFSIPGWRYDALKDFKGTKVRVFGRPLLS